MSVPDDEAAELANDLAIANAQVKWMEAENERLRADKENWQKVCEGALKEQFRLAALNAELRAALRPFVNARIVDATMRENARLALEGGIRSSA